MICFSYPAACERDMITENLKPERLWYHFEKMSDIPRCSGREEDVSEYVRGVADSLGFSHRRDAAGNVVILKPASPSLTHLPPLVLQSHLDMVCEKNNDSAHDFEREGVRLRIDDGWVRASGTSLGADNGIGAAAMLALLEEGDDGAGPLEMLFTVEEETGLTGAVKIGQGLITGMSLINLDGDRSATLTIGCAGGRDSDLFVPPEYPGEKPVGPKADLLCFNIGVAGLRGGHSGSEIHLGRANAIKQLGRLLGLLRRTTRLRLSSIRGGDKHNAIPREAFATVFVPREADSLLRRTVGEFGEMMSRQFGSTDPGIDVVLTVGDESAPLLPTRSTERIIDLIGALPHGVLAMSPVMEGLVETSSNISSVRTGDDGVVVHASHRSSLDRGIEGVAGFHRELARMLDVRIEQDEGYPAWEPDFDSPILQDAREAVRAVTGRDPVVRAMHAGLEPGIFKKKFPGLDAVSIGPTIEDAHSPDERVSIESVAEFHAILKTTIRMIYDHPDDL
jgi:dipeptidase D